MDTDDSDESNGFHSGSGINSMDFDWHNPGSETSLRRAVRANDFNQLKALLRDGSDPNITDNRGWTVVHEAARSDRYCKVLKLLIKFGGYLNHQTYQGETPLFIACSNGAAKIVKILLEHKCNVNLPNSECTMPLHAACSKPNAIEVVKMLLDANAMIDVPNIEKESPLFIAIEKNNVRACTLLLEAGASTKLVDSFDRTPLHFACSEGNFETFKLLTEYSGGVEGLIHYSTRQGWSLLMEAAQSKGCLKVKYLLDVGVDPNRVDNRRVLALHLAAHSGCTECFNLLLTSTSSIAIEEHSTFTGNPLNPISLTCLVLDSRSYDNLVSLFDAGLSLAVLACPIVKRRSLYNPYSYLIDSAAISPNEKLRFLGLMLDKKLPLDPEYHGWEKRIVSPVEAVCRFYKCLPEYDYICYEYLKLLLENGANPDIMKSDEMETPNSLPKSFCLAYRKGFIQGLALLLRYTNLIEPNKLLMTYCEWLVSPLYIFTDNEFEVFKFLVPLCTNVTEVLQRFSPRIEEREETYGKLLQIQSVLLEQDFTYSLQQLCRTAVRKEIRRSTHPDLTEFRKKLSSLDVPKSVLKYIMYDELLSV